MNTSLTEHSYENTDKKSGYRKTLESITLFGGVQTWKILIEIIRQKIVATLLGPFGIGFIELLTSATSLIQSLTSMGLSTSAIKSIAEANSSKDINKISRIIITFRRLVILSGSLGMFIVIVFAPFLSKTTFDNYNYTLTFIILSITILFQQLSVGQSVLLQGLKKFRHLALASVLGSLFGLLTSVPLYYLLGLDGIVPSLILSSITVLLLTWFFSRRIHIKKQNVNLGETIYIGREMIRIGFAVSLTSILGMLSSYILKIYIAKLGGTHEVGLFSAGFAIVNGYVGLVFTAMATDYYPRLVEVNSNKLKYTELINHQAEIALLLLSPIVIIFLMISPQIVKILYTNDFLPIVPFMKWAMIGMLFRPAAGALSYLFLAKGDMGSFLWTDLSIKFINLPLYIIFYKYFGLNGLGLSFMINNIIYMLLVIFVSYRKYRFKFSNETNKVFFVNLILIIIFILINLIFNSKFIFIPSLFILIISILFSLKLINNRLSLKLKKLLVFHGKK